jgi:hypothetical protein
MIITRDVVSDLWPLYVSGEASDDTRRLVDEFLDADPEFAAALRASEAIPAPGRAVLAPDHEARALESLQRQLRGYPWLLHASMFATALAFGRIVSDTSWDVSPRLFIVHCIVAAALWTAYVVTLQRKPRGVLRRP